MPRSVLRESLRRGLIQLRPELYWRYYEWRRGLPEPELAVLPALCRRDALSLDIGANLGLYTCALLECSSGCVAFEPLPAMARLLRRSFRRARDRFRLEQVALSDAVGKAELRAPRGTLGNSTIEPENLLRGPGNASGVTVHEVETRCLDDYALENVAFIKIDVEGHEERVLRGGRKTLERHRPSLVVEIEERHKPGSVAAVRGLLGELGYEGFFLDEGRLRPFDELDLGAHQDERVPERYIRNFIFPAEGARERLEEALSHQPERRRHSPTRM
jgi:FkbM family methyltransferase